MIPGRTKSFQTSTLIFVKAGLPNSSSKAGMTWSAMAAPPGTAIASASGASLAASRPTSSAVFSPSSKDIAAASATNRQFFEPEMLHGCDERFKGRVGRDAGFFFRRAEQFDNARSCCHRRHGRAAEDDDLRFLPCQHVNAVPVIAKCFLDSFRSIVFQTERGRQLHNLKWHEPVKLIARPAVEIFMGARMDHAVAKTGHQLLGMIVHVYLQ